MALSGIRTYQNQYQVYNVKKVGTVEENPASSDAIQEDIAGMETLTDQTDQDNAVIVTQQPSSSGITSDSSTSFAQSTYDLWQNNNFRLDTTVKSGIQDTDVEQAISNMRKDSVLDQYKFFVSPGNLGTDQDGTVRLLNQK